MPKAKPQNPQARTIRISRLTLLGVLLLACCIAFLAAAEPFLFGWLVAVPIFLAVWILRVQTRVSETALELRTLFRTRTVLWDDIQGLTFPKYRSARAVLTSGTQVPLPTVTFEDLPKITPLSNGRIPDIEASLQAQHQEQAERQEQREHTTPRHQENPPEKFAQEKLSQEKLSE